MTRGRFRTTALALTVAFLAAAWNQGALALGPSFFPLAAKVGYDAETGYVFVYAFDAWYEYKVTEKQSITSAEFSTFAELYHSRVTVTFSNGTVRQIYATDFSPLTAPPLALRQASSGAGPIAVSHDADAFDPTCDGRAVVVGANSATPVSLVDFTAQSEVAKLAYAGRLARAVSVGDDDRTVLVVVDSATNSTGGAIRRLTVDATNTLADSGEELSFGSQYVSKVRVAPGAKTGVALVGQFPARLVSFAIPGLAIKGSATLGQGIGNAIVFGPAGNRIYARSGRRGIVPDIIEAFAYDPISGSIGQSPALAINDVTGFTGVVFNEPMTISADGRALIAAEEAPASRFTTFDVETGAIIGTESTRGLRNPRTLGTTRPCARASVRPAVEFYNAGLDHYFITWAPDEIAGLDAGTVSKGWARTGKSFPVYASAQVGSSPVCRYYIPPALGDSHFFGRGTAECAATGQRNPTFVLEDPAFMHVILPTAGLCPTNTINVYRVFSNRPDANHRYTTDRATRNEMVAKGWLAEGGRARPGRDVRARVEGGQ